MAKVTCTRTKKPKGRRGLHGLGYEDLLRWRLQTKKRCFNIDREKMRATVPFTVCPTNNNSMLFTRHHERQDSFLPSIGGVHVHLIGLAHVVPPLPIHMVFFPPDEEPTLSLLLCLLSPVPFSPLAELPGGSSHARSSQHPPVYNET